MISLAAIKSFFSFSNWSVYLVIGGVLVYGYYRIDSLNAQKELLETKVEHVIEKNERIAGELTRFKTQIVNDLGEQKIITEKVNQSNKRNEKRMSELYDTFNTSADGTERKLDELSIAKPNLIEKRINDATYEVFGDVEKNSDISIGD